LNLAVFSISHKIELKLFHDIELHYFGDSEGMWEMRECATQEGPITRARSHVKYPSRALTGSAMLHYERHVPQREDGSTGATG